MAKTAADYIAEGRALYTESTDKTTPYPHAKSWQQKAVNQGFAEAFADEADKQAAARAKETHAETLQRVDAQIRNEHAEKDAIAALQKREFVNAAGGFQVPRAVLKHCNQLQAVAQQSDDPARAARCARKIEKIMMKWGKRAYAHQLRAGL